MLEIKQSGTIDSGNRQNTGEHTLSHFTLPSLIVGTCAALASIGYAGEESAEKTPPASPPAVTQPDGEKESTTKAVTPTVVAEEKSIHETQSPTVHARDFGEDPILPLFFPEESLAQDTTPLLEIKGTPPEDRNDLQPPTVTKPIPTEELKETAKTPQVAAASSTSAVSETTVQHRILTSFWNIAQVVGPVAGLIGVPFLWLTWRKRADEVLDRARTNDDIKTRKLESDIRLNIHRFEKKDDAWHMQIIGTGRETVKNFFGGQGIYAEILARAASLCTPEQPFPMFHFARVLNSKAQRFHAFLQRMALPDVDLMSDNCRVRIRDLISAKYNPERRSLDTEKSFEQKRIFGILLREKTPRSSTLVLCVIPENSFAKFGDKEWVNDLKANSDPHGVARINQLMLAYEKEESFLKGESQRSVFPWAYVYFPQSAKKREQLDLDTRAVDTNGNGHAQADKNLDAIFEGALPDRRAEARH